MGRPFINESLFFKDRWTSTRIRSRQPFEAAVFLSWFPACGPSLLMCDEQDSDIISPNVIVNEKRAYTADFTQTNRICMFVQVIVGLHSSLCGNILQFPLCSLSGFACVFVS